jgi:small nuclear ribonucleoprotein (snRNP)-like protein
MNLVLSDVEETRVSGGLGSLQQRRFPLLYVRGANVALIAPQTV